MAKQSVNPKVGVWLDRVQLASAVTMNYMRQLPGMLKLRKNEATGEWEFEFKKPQLMLPAPPIPEEEQKLHKLLRDIDNPETAARIEEAYRDDMAKKAAAEERRRLEEEARAAQIAEASLQLESQLEAITAQMRESESVFFQAKEVATEAQRKREAAEGTYHQAKTLMQQATDAIARNKQKATELWANAHECDDAVAKAQEALELLQPKLETLQLQLNKPPVPEGQEELFEIEADGSDVTLKVKPTKGSKPREILLCNLEDPLAVIRKLRPIAGRKVTAYLVDRDVQHPQYSNGSGYIAEEIHGQLVIGTHGLQPAALQVVTLNGEGNKRTHTLQIQYQPADGAKTSGPMVLRINL